MQRENLLDYMESDIYRPLTAQELSEVFDLNSASEFRDLVKLLNEMEDNGEVVRTKNNRYGLPEQMNLVAGKLQMKARGFGFVISDATGESDVYIPATEMNGAMSGDRVLAKVTDNQAKAGPHREGVIVRVIERANDRVVGKITIYPTHAFVDPIDKRFGQDILIPKEAVNDAHDGYIVVAEITSFPTGTHGPVGKVIEVLGHPDEPGVDILSVIRKYALPETFPDAVLQAAEAIPIEIDPAEIENRRDLRDVVMVTIDSESAKDLDDAVHVKKLENGNYELGVHIADVGYYVKEGGVIDKEAFRRGTSVYLVDRVIPMLPQRLSNNICSLNPNVDRLTLTCEMEIDEDGKTVRHDVYPSIIKTTARMTYNNVRKILVDHDEDVINEYKPLVPMFQQMEELAHILRNKRLRRGAVDFDFAEIYVKVNDLGEPIEIVPRQRSIAERLIEEFMLAANETVAEHFHWLGVPFVYRVHDEPNADKMFDLNVFLHNFGYHLKGVGGSKIHPRALQEVLSEVEGTKEARMISTVMLRSMQQAKYKPDCTGHFGLAAEYYTHFTSPIRRYPDLTIHRIIREASQGPLSEHREAQLADFVEEASRQSSERERLAQDAEREVDQLKMVEYMQAHVGEEFNGILASVTSFGVFVQLDNGVEGLIHISTLDDDYYVFNERQMALIGERNRRVFRMGDPVRIEVARASKEDLQIDFALIEHFREGTYVGGQGAEAIVYDEDLSPKDRRQSERRREERSSAGPRRGDHDPRAGGHAGRSRRDKASGRTIEGGYGRAGRARDAEPPVNELNEDMPMDEWDRDFPDPREAREQQRGGSRGNRGNRHGYQSAASYGDDQGGDRDEATGRIGGYRVWPGAEGGRADRGGGGRNHGGRGGRDDRGRGRRDNNGRGDRNGSDRREDARSGFGDDRREDWRRRDKSSQSVSSGQHGGRNRNGGFGSRDRNGFGGRDGESGGYGSNRGSRGRREEGTGSDRGGRPGGRNGSGEGRYGRGNGGGGYEGGEGRHGGSDDRRGGNRSSGGSRSSGYGNFSGGDGGKPRKRHAGGAKFGAKSSAHKAGGRGGRKGR